MFPPIAAAEQFNPSGQITEIRLWGKGRVHDTFLVSADHPRITRFILQRLNTRVFRQPLLINRNIRTFTEHMSRRLEHFSLPNRRRWEVPLLLLAGDRDHWIDPSGAFWRAMSYIDRTQTFDSIRNLDQAGEVGWALGLFHTLLSDLPIEKLADTLEGFHITPRYLAHYDRVLTDKRPRRSPEVDYILNLIEERRNRVDVLEGAKAEGKLRLRPIHGDPKINNILFDALTREAVGLVDLDTVKPGLVHYDIADCLRSGCNPLGEDLEQWEQVRFDPDYCRAILQGYLSIAGEHFRSDDYDYLYEAIRLIPFELGLRFFSDFLEGNLYFKVEQSRQNLIRALIQFRLTESIEAQAAEIQSIIRELR